jgi:hypothetical protein
MEAPTIVYRRRLVAFLDVMGFKELLRADVESINKLQMYYDKIFTYLDGKSNLYQNTAQEDEFKKMLVSDSIIMSIVLDGDDTQKLNKTARFLSSVSLIQYLLAVECDIWTRGGVSLGNLFIDEAQNVLVGSAFVSAFNLEEKANYLRVIVDPMVCKELDILPNRLIEKLEETGYKGVLMGSDQTARFGRLPFVSDCLQIDWFRHAFERTENLNGFFNGFKERITSNQSLYEKAQQLGYYLRNSYDREVVSRQGGKPNRNKMIDDFLTEIGF